LRGWYPLTEHPDAATHPGLVVYRFGAGIVFFNAGYFKRRVLEIVASHPGTEWLILDGSTVTLLDLTGTEMLDTLTGELAARGVHLGLANVHRDVRARLDRAGVLDHIGTASVFPTLNSATDAFLTGKRP
jgi:MFS superfamily sulfate permease-like transporter